MKKDPVLRWWLCSNHAQCSSPGFCVYRKPIKVVRDNIFRRNVCPFFKGRGLIRVGKLKRALESL